MKRREAITAAVGLLFILAAFAFSSFQDPPVFPFRNSAVVTANCTVPYSYFEPTPSDSAHGTAVILHGLSANRKLMASVARWMVATGLNAYTIDMPGHGNSAEPFSFERAEQCAAEFVAELTNRCGLDASRTILVGHSTGAGIAIRLADRFDAVATIAISPAPLTPQPGPWENATPFTLPNRLPANLLVFIASLDPFPIRDSAKQWVTAAGPDNSDATFAERRALRLIDVPRNTHTSLLVDSQVARVSTDWTQHALAMPPLEPHLRIPQFAYVVALLGVMLIFPATASLMLGRAHVSAGANSSVVLAAGSYSSPAKSYITWTVASVLAVLALKFWIPLRTLRLLSGDYLASFLLIVGLLAIAAYWRREQAPKSYSAEKGWPFLSRNMVATLFLAFAAFLAASWLLAWQATDVWMNTARWMRFPFVALAVFPYALAEEWALGSPRPGGKGVLRRVLRALGLRMILLLVLIAAFLLLRSNQVLIPLLALYLLMFSIAQRLGADAIRRRSGSALAAALFGAILGGWYISAVFPLL